MIIVSKEDKDFLADDISDNENDNQNDDVNSLDEKIEGAENVSQTSEEFLCETSDKAESSILNEVNNEVDDVKEAEEDNGYSSQFGELDEFVDNSADIDSDMKSKKQSKPLSTKQVLIIAVIVIVAVAVIGLGAYFIFFNNSIKSGAWIPVTIDETTQEVIESEDDTIKQYYKFTDNEMVVYYANSYAANESACEISYEGDTIVMQDGTNLKLTYDISGNLIKGKYLTLTIAGYEDQPLSFKWSSNVETPELTGPKFTKNDKILGYWKYSNGSNIVYKEFTADGFTNEYTAYEGTYQKYSQMYNFDGKNVITLSSGGTDIYGATVEPGAEETTQAEIDGDTLTLYMNSIPYEFTKSSKEEYEEFKSSVIAGTYEYPTVDYSQYEVATTETTKDTTEKTTEGTTEVITETVSE